MRRYTKYRIALRCPFDLTRPPALSFCKAGRMLAVLVPRAAAISSLLLPVCLTR